MVEDSTSIARLLNEFGLRITTFEERMRIIEDKIRTLNNTIITQGKSFNEDLDSLRQKLQDIESTLIEIKGKVDYIISEAPSFVRRDEMKIIERFINMWQPIKFARIEDVKRLVDEKVREMKKNEKIEKDKE